MSSELNWSKPLQTRDGRKARFIGSINHRSYPNVAAVEMKDDGLEGVLPYTEDGHYLSTQQEHNLDIVNVPKKIKVHLFRDETGKAQVHEGEFLDNLCVSAAERSGDGIIAEVDAF